VEITTLEGPHHPIAILGVCQGLEGEDKRVIEALRELQPSVIALAVPPEILPEIEGLQGDAERGLEDSAYAVGLSRWGNVQLPPPELAAVVVAGRELRVRVEGVDLGEERYLDLFADVVGLRHLVQRAWRLRWLGWKAPSADGPEAFCRTFDARINTGPFAKLEGEREAAMARGLALLNPEGATAFVVEVQRVDGVTKALRALPRPARPLQRA
jgi:hypothetical protein